jgi:hypothetical protein
LNRAIGSGGGADDLGAQFVAAVDGGLRVGDRGERLVVVEGTDTSLSPGS